MDHSFGGTYSSWLNHPGFTHNLLSFLGSSHKRWMKSWAVEGRVQEHSPWFVNTVGQ